MASPDEVERRLEELIERLGGSDDARASLRASITEPRVLAQRAGGRPPGRGPLPGGRRTPPFLEAPEAFNEAVARFAGSVRRDRSQADSA